MTRVVLGWCCAVLLLSACPSPEDSGPGKMLLPDSGVSLPDAGAPAPDAGDPPEDAGDVPADAGTSEPDAGTPTDAGTPSTTLTVRGTVENSKGMPLADVTVLLPGHPTVRTNASGAFQFQDVTPPYALLMTDDTRRTVFVHQDITRPDPILTMPIRVPGEAFSATLGGTIHGVDHDEINRPRTAFVSTGWPNDSVSTPSEDYNSEDSLYSTHVSWDGPDSVMGTLYAYQRPFRASNAWRFGQRDHVRLRQGETLSDQDVTLHPVESAALAGTIASPPGFKRLVDTVNLEVAPSVLLPLFDNYVSGPHFSYTLPLLPQLPQATFELITHAAGPDAFSISTSVRRGLGAGGPDLNVVLREPVTPLLPQDATAGVGPGTEFTWSAASEAVYTLSIEETTSEGMPFFLYVYTNEPHATLPDPSGLGVEFPHHGSFQWRVGTSSPFSSVDDLLRGANTTGYPRGVSALDFTGSASRTFTSAGPTRARP